ncbi:hypothetical protein AV530_008961 [Patagioenas fasciata monilis]|uniref:Uncharacterized protein n=1 Tax=Patagioenas fasciata monilis TaxID=372326 RepID=A0A1V4JF27_PATFA|nr:hypothetical protein AV530_008961 [Patagioenas fasciata monilis]
MRLGSISMFVNMDVTPPAENTSPGERVAAAALEDSKDTSRVPSSPTILSQPPDLFEYVTDGGCSKDQVVAVGLGDSEDTIPDVLRFPNSLRELDESWEQVDDSGCCSLRNHRAHFHPKEQTTP